MVAITLASLMAFATSASALVVPSLNQPSNELLPRQTSNCSNTATSRDCWDNGLNINTDFYSTLASTGVVREYWLTVVEADCAPDGFNRTCHTFNGTVPGPLITANWGDTLRVHVTNNFAENGTTVHWHGIRQLNSGEMDGVPGTTQCPIAPGKTMTYDFQLTQYGTTWYHSHLSMQYADGQFGPLIINGPASANYDEDLGTFFLQDWNHAPIFEIWDADKNSVGILDTTLMNGTNTYNGGGEKAVINVVAGQTYRLRLINVAVEAGFQFSIDGHNLTVISVDLVPITPFATDYVLINIGQRYDVVFTADAGSGDFWVRGGWNSVCNNNNLPDNMTAILRYDSNSTADPTTTSSVTAVGFCHDFDQTDLVPVVALPFTGDFSNMIVANLTASFLTGAVDIPYTEWYIDGSNYVANWSNPTLGLVDAGETVFPTDYNVFEINAASDNWTVFIVNNETPVNHPYHMHGHDFWILEQNIVSEWTGDTSAFSTTNPTRRDVAVIPADGYLAIAFPNDNPGAWIAHCHIAWHQSQGLAFQFLESMDQIATSGAIANWATIGDPICNGFDAYVPTEEWAQDDSGI